MPHCANTHQNVLANLDRVITSMSCGGGGGGGVHMSANMPQYEGDEFKNIRTCIFYPIILFFKLTIDMFIIISSKKPLIYYIYEIIL